MDTDSERKKQIFTEANEGNEEGRGSGCFTAERYVTPDAPMDTDLRGNGNRWNDIPGRSGGRADGTA